MDEKQMTRQSDMTEKLFYEDGYCKEFTARVLSCGEEKNGGGYRVVLDRTAFFPEGGGQFGDIGWLGDAVVRDTQEKAGVIYHFTDQPLTAGQQVEGRIDFEERFVRMQQHTGEHILSGVVHRLYGYNNVGFHLGTDVTTLDFDGELTPEQADEVETLANRAVFDNIPVEILYPSREELAKLDYRSKIEIEGQVRLVSIPGIDLCACCAPHLRATGEIGLIKILACDRHRGGCRMTMVSGMRALEDYRNKQHSVTEVSVELSARPGEIGEAVRHQKEQMQKEREHLNQLQAAYLNEKLDEITDAAQNVCIFVEAFDLIAVRNFVNSAMKRSSGICAAFVGSEKNGYHYILGSSSMDMRVFSKKLNAAFAGRGGGRPEMVQGSLVGRQEEIRQMICESE